MFIKRLKIKNYRNLDNIDVEFSSNINYIVGDNNIGKSNLLKLFDKLFNNSLKENDYFDREKRITIELFIEIFPEENVNFKFNTKDNEVHLILSQGIYESFPKLVDTNKTNYDYKILKKIVFKEINPSNNLLTDINKDRLLDLLQNDIANLKSLSIEVSQPSNQLYITMASCQIYQAIYNELKNENNRTNIYTKNEKRLLALSIGLDEPELHLNPYLQRTLINYYKRLLNNKDETFLNILKTDFNIDRLESNLYIVTHSTEALIDDYKSIIRIYKKPVGNGVASGASVNLKPNVSKHLSMMFSDIKEAFFCKKAIIVEGVTEFGAFKRFAEVLKTPLDEYGICLINAQGEGSISKIKALLNAFKIENFQVYDGDVRRGKEPSSNEFFTKEVCFEMEIVSDLVSKKQFDLLEEIASQIPGYSSQIFDDQYVRRTFEKINYCPSNFKKCRLRDIKRDDIELYKAAYFTWFYRKKGLYLGRIIGDFLTFDLIPNCYKDAIRTATNKN